MKRTPRRRPFYRRPWLWVTVLVLLVGGSWFAVDRLTTTETQDDTVVKVPKKTDKKKKSAKKHSTKKEQDQAVNNGSQATASQTTTQPSQNQAATTPNSGGGQTTTPVSDNNSSSQEPWVDPDNYEPNSIIGDRSTMYCYLPGQYPDPGIAPENIIYFNSLEEARAAGYNTVQ